MFALTVLLYLSAVGIGILIGSAVRSGSSRVRALAITLGVASSLLFAVGVAVVWWVFTSFELTW